MSISENSGQRPHRNRVRCFYEDKNGSWSNNGWYASSSLAEFCEWMETPAWDPEQNPRITDLPPETHPCFENSVKTKVFREKLVADKAAAEAKQAQEIARRRTVRICITTAVSIVIVLILTTKELS